MSRKGESIFKRKDGRFEGRYIKKYVDNKAIYGYVYAKTYNECKKKRNLKVINIKINKPIKKTNYNLNQLINIWLNNKKDIKESTYTKYYNVIEEHIKNEIGLIKVNKIDNKIVNEYLNNKLNNGRKDKQGGLSKNTVYAISNILKQVFKENNINIEMMKISTNIGVGKSLYSNERKELIDHLNEINNNISLGIKLSLILGLRKGEVCGIKLSDIDLDNKVLYINHIVTRIKVFNEYKKTKLILSTPKTSKSKRILPIPDKLINELEIIKNKYNNNYFLLTNSEKYMDPRTYYNYYKKYLNEINLNYTYHDLRHTFATNCVELGIDYKSLMELLGHSSITTTMNVYVHPTINSKRIFINQL